MSSSAESDFDEETRSMSRLGECEVCGGKNAIYTCPKCEVKTCSLGCVRIHKKELDCDGMRDRTKFIRIKDFTDTDLLSDYRLLEECARFVHAVKKDEKKRYTRIDKDLPIHLHKLKLAARRRGTVLQFLSQNFTRHSINTTRYNFKTGLIHWRVEWVFPNVESEPLKFIDEKCPEGSRLSMLLDKYLNAEAPPFEGSKHLTYYRAAGFNGVKILLKAEKVKGSSKKFFEMDLADTLAENLSGKCLVEFPIIFVVLKDHAYNFEITTPEEEFELDKNTPCINQESNIVNKEPHGGEQNNSNENYLLRKKPKLLLTEKIAQEKKTEIEKEIREARRKKPKNLLFTTGYSSEESLEHSDHDTD